MGLFKAAANDSAYLKAGFMGFTGSGKTYTASQVAVGLVKHLREKGAIEGDRPAMFLDTETGSDWVRDLFANAGVQLQTAKTRAFTDLLGAIGEAEQEGSVLLIDSITHFWRELTDSYAKKRRRTRGLEFQDWAYLKGRWGEFTDAFVNSRSHIIMCGRAGYEYDFFENDSGKRELEKTGVKMKAEAETGYEPSILVLMERDMDLESKTVYRTAHILKDRARILDGKHFRNPTFETFLPHIERLNIGGKHVGVDTSRDSADTIPGLERDNWKHRETQRAILLDKIKALFVKCGLDGTGKDEKKKRIEVLAEHFGTASWVEIEEAFDLVRTLAGYNRLHKALTGQPSEYEAEVFPDPTSENPEPAAEAA